MPGPTQLTAVLLRSSGEGREIVAAYGDGLVLLDGKNVGEVQRSLQTAWVSKTSTGTLWLYAASRTGSIVAFTVKNNGKITRY